MIWPCGSWSRRRRARLVRNVHSLAGVNPKYSTHDRPWGCNVVEAASRIGIISKLRGVLGCLLQPIVRLFTSPSVTNFAALVDRIPIDCTTISSFEDPEQCTWYRESSCVSLSTVFERSMPTLRHPTRVCKYRSRRADAQTKEVY